MSPMCSILGLLALSSFRVTAAMRLDIEDITAMRVDSEGMNATRLEGQVEGIDIKEKLLEIVANKIPGDYDSRKGYHPDYPGSFNLKICDSDERKTWVEDNADPFTVKCAMVLMDGDEAVVKIAGFDLCLKIEFADLELSSRIEAVRGGLYARATISYARLYIRKEGTNIRRLVSEFEKRDRKNIDIQSLGRDFKTTDAHVGMQVVSKGVGTFAGTVRKQVALKLQDVVGNLLQENTGIYTARLATNKKVQSLIKKWYQLQGRLIEKCEKP